MPKEENVSGRFIGQVLVAVGIIVMTILLILLIYNTFDIVLLVFAAILLAIFLRGLADLLSRYIKISEGWAVLLVSFLLLLIFGGAIALLAPSVAEQAQHLREELPKSAAAVSGYISQNTLGKTIIDQLPSANDIIQTANVSTVLSRVGGYFSSTVGAVGNFFVVILLAIYLGSEPQFYADGLTKLFPVKQRPQVHEVLENIGETLSWWLIGKVASMIFIGVLTWIGLWALGVPLSLTLGLIAGLLSFIPNFGPIFSALPAILLAFIESPIKAVYVLILFIVVQIIESNIVTPYIERRTVELPPALTLVSQIALGVLIGGLGLVLATPILAVVMVLVQTIYIQNVLGDKEDVQRKDTETQRREDFKEESEEEFSK